MRGLISVAEAARRYDVPLSTMRRRIKAAAETYKNLVVVLVPDSRKRKQVLVRESVLERIVNGPPEREVFE